MSVDFRQRTPGEYARIIWKRKWLIILPTIALACAIAIVVHRLPNIYESTTLIVVKPATVASSVVPAVSEDQLTRQLNSINQVVTSRSSLQPLIEKYGLYQDERMRGIPMEDIIEDMRKDIHVEVNTSRNDITNGFNITYRARNPKAAQVVTSELATKFINAQTEATVLTSKQTKEFFEQQMAQVKQQLDDIDKRRLEYMQQNVSNLPSQAQSLIGQLTGLREQQKSLITEVGRLRDQRTSLETQLADLKKMAQQETDEIARVVGDPKATPAYAELVKRKSQLESEYENMLTTLRPRHPDVISKKAELDSVKAAMNEMVEEGKAKIEEIRQQRADRIDPRIKTIEYNLKSIESEIARQQKILDETEVQIAAINQRINSVPGAEVTLESLNREYMTQKATYDDLLKKQQNAELVASVAANQQGETIQVIDAANLPESPVAPRRGVLMGFGVIIGFGVGLFLAGLFEVPRLLTIQTSEDAAHYTGLPVLISVPELLTPQEARSLPMRRRLALAVGIVGTVVSIPVLAYVIRVTHVFERFVS